MGVLLIFTEYFTKGVLVDVRTVGGKEKLTT